MVTGTQLWVRPGGPRRRALEAVTAAQLALSPFPQLYVFSDADEIVRSVDVMAHTQARSPAWHRGTQQHRQHAGLLSRNPLMLRLRA